MLYLAGSDPKGESTEGSVGGCMTITADYGHARLSQAQLWADYVNNSLVRAVQSKKLDSKLVAICFQSLNLSLGNLIQNG
jgi:hypothetical protein